MNNQDTIIALATPYGVSALAIIRLSGKDAIALTDAFFYAKTKGKNLLEQPSHTVHLGYLMDGETVLDEVLVTLFKNPHSYTGEDAVEISCHGSTYIQQAIIQLFIKNGVRAAEPGEFTLRAFLNGKMDLSQTEAVADLIHSQSEAAKNIAIKQLRGGFSNDLKRIKEQLIQFASLIELELDFSEEDLEFADRSELRRLVQKALEHVQKLADSFCLGNAIKNGVYTAIVGKPNAGKSTLLNALLNEDRAIVTDIPGTTRDTLEEVMHIGGLLFRFIDTAGIRETEDVVEKIGVSKAWEKLHASDVFMYLFDVNNTTPKMLQAELQMLPKDIPHLLIGNKADLSNSSVLDDFEKTGEKILFISAKDGQSIEIIKQKLLEKLDLDKIDTNATIVSNARHYEALRNVAISLQDVLQGIQNGLTGDLLAIDIRQALFHLGSVTGEITGDDILGNIFQNFCVGK